MTFTEELERIRREMHLTQLGMAQRLGMSLATYKDYIYGVREMSPWLQNHTAKALKSPRLALLMLAQFEDNPFAPLALDVDTHPAQEVSVALREMKEVEDALMALDLSKLSSPQARRAVDQMMDLKHLLPLAITALCDKYRLDPWACSKSNTSKIKSRGYLEGKAGQAA